MLVHGLIWGILTMTPVLACVGDDFQKPDSYSLNIVQFVLKMRSGGQKFIFTPAQKQLYRLGDGVSIALIKILDQGDLINPKTVKDILPIVVDGFDEPKLIALKANAKPGVTLLLLDYLRKNVRDVELQRDIEKTAEHIKAKASELPQAASSVAGQQESSSDSVQEVQTAMMAHISSFSQKQLQGLGDRASIALIKLYSLEELTTADNIRKYLPAIQDAFNAPKTIAIPEDRQPRVTLILLHYLQGELQDKGLQAEVGRIEEMIRHTSSGQ